MLLYYLANILPQIIIVDHFNYNKAVNSCIEKQGGLLHSASQHFVFFAFDLKPSCKIAPAYNALPKLFLHFP